MNPKDIKKLIKEIRKEYLNEDTLKTCSSDNVDKSFGKNCGGCEAQFTIEFLERHIEFLNEEPLSCPTALINE